MATILPGRGSRYGMAAVAVVAAALLWDPNESGDEAVRGLLTLLLAVLALRSLRVGVHITEDAVTYRGYLLTRRVHRRQVRRVTNFPCLVWETAAGRTRWSPMPCFMQSSRVPERGNRLARERVRDLRKALNLRRDGNRG